MSSEKNNHIDPDGLTLKQRKFVEAYLGRANGNATEAARLAGYACPGSVGHENLSKPEIQHVIQRRLKENVMSADEVLARLADDARCSMAYFISIKGGQVSLDLEKAERMGKMHLITELAPTRYGWKIKLRDGQAALIQLGRYYGLFKDRQQVELSLEDLDAMIEAEQKRLGATEKEESEE